jgi:hypothetical protein
LALGACVLSAVLVTSMERLIGYVDTNPPWVRIVHQVMTMASGAVLVILLKKIGVL